MFGIFKRIKEIEEWAESAWNYMAKLRQDLNAVCDRVEIDGVTDAVDRLKAAGAPDTRIIEFIRSMQVTFSAKGQHSIAKQCEELIHAHVEEMADRKRQAQGPVYIDMESRRFGQEELKRTLERVFGPQARPTQKRHDHFNDAYKLIHAAMPTTMTIVDDPETVKKLERKVGDLNLSLSLQKDLIHKRDGQIKELTDWLVQIANALWTGKPPREMTTFAVVVDRAKNRMNRLAIDGMELGKARKRIKELEREVDELRATVTPTSDTVTPDNSAQ